jgi:hypothetical protein
MWHPIHRAGRSRDVAPDDQRWSSGALTEPVNCAVFGDVATMTNRVTPVQWATGDGVAAEAIGGSVAADGGSDKLPGLRLCSKHFVPC